MLLWVTVPVVLRAWWRACRGLADRPSHPANGSNGPSSSLSGAAVGPGRAQRLRWPWRFISSLHL